MKVLCRRLRSREIALALGGLSLVWATGCGYSGDSLYPQNVRTVFVDMFQTKEFRRGIEFQLTEAVRKEIDRRTPYRNAPKEKADTVLSGEVLEWRAGSIGRDPITALPRQSVGSLVISYRWQDMRTGKLLIEQPRLVTTIDYVQATGENSYEGYSDAVNRLARKIVAGMETGW